MRGTRRLPALLVCAVALTACGSTVAPGSDAADLTQPGTDGLGVSTGDGLTQVPGSDVGAPTGPGAAPGAGPVSTGGTRGSGTTGTTGAGPSQVGSGGRVPDARAAAGADGLGVTRTEVRIGLTYTVGSEAANAALGADVQVGDTKAYYEALLRHVNTTGGIRGRKLVPVYAKEDAQSAETRDAKDEARCAEFTQDNKVFAVLDSSPSDNFLSCVQRSAINIGGFEGTGYLEADFRKHRYFFDVNTLPLEKQYGYLVPSLQRQQWFGGWDTAAGSSSPVTKPVVGVLSVDLPMFAFATDKVLLPALARAGHPVDPDNVVRLYSGKSQAEVSRTVSEIQSAVLRFRTNGVTHVVIFDNGGGVTLFFAQNADGQGYYPRYGVTHANYLQSLVSAGQIPPRTARGALGLGHVPFVDIPPADNPDDGPYSNDTRRLCLKIFRDAQIDLSDNNVRAVAVGFCDKVLFFANVARSVEGPLNRETFRQAVDRLGTSYRVGALQTARFDADHHYSVDRGYDMRFDEACTCVRYVRAVALD